MSTENIVVTPKSRLSVCVYVCAMIVWITQVYAEIVCMCVCMCYDRVDYTGMCRDCVCVCMYVL